MGGRLHGARDALTRAAVTGPGAPATALPREDALARLALLDVLHGWPDRAERTAREALAETERSGLARPASSGVERLVLAAVAVEREELGRARALLDTAGESHPALRDPVLEAGRALVAARLHLARGEPAAAWKAVEPGVPADADSPWARGETALVAAAADLAEGRPQDAAALLPEVPRDQPACAVGAARCCWPPDGPRRPYGSSTGRPSTSTRPFRDRTGRAGTGPRRRPRGGHHRGPPPGHPGGDGSTPGGPAPPLAETGSWIRPYLTPAPATAVPSRPVPPEPRPRPSRN